MVPLLLDGHNEAEIVHYRETFINIYRYYLVDFDVELTREAEFQIRTSYNHLYIIHAERHALTPFSP